MSDSHSNITPPLAPVTLLSLLRDRARLQGDDVAFVFLRDGEHEERRLTYRELELRARAIATQLQATCPRGARALLLYPAGLEYICGFFGCLFAGVIAVPVYPPTGNRWQRIEGIALDSGATHVLGDQATLATLRDAAADWSRLQPLATDTIDAAGADAWRDPGIDGDTIAFLQYTSGSTGDAKGVVVSHANLLHNEALIREGFGTERTDVVVGWLPLYHDMGLIGNVLHPLYLGARAVLMSPMAFLQQPLRWLRAIDRYRGTVSGGPNFAYELCAERATDAELSSLDLSSWQVAYNGAEPVRADTLRRFAEAFHRCGFQAGAFFPCYGLAEATLFASGADRHAPPSLIRADAAALRNDGYMPSCDAQSVRLVSSGHADPTRLCIVQPVDGHRLPDGQVGEIWLRGASIARGYWQRPETSAETFAAYTHDGAGPFLRSGDLGFVQDGQLYVTGRMKELIIVRGRNHYPQDIEQTVQACSASLAAGAGAAFSVEVDGEERVVVVQEVRRSEVRRVDVRELELAVRAALAAAHELQLLDLVLLKPMRLPKTSSGKIQRRKARELYLSGALEGRLLAATSPARVELAHTPPRNAVEAQLTAIWAQVFCCERVGVDDDFFACGGDSLRAAQLVARVRTTFAVDLSVGAVYEARTLAGLADRIATASHSEVEAPAAVARNAPLPLSYAQQRLWFLDQLEGPSANYNMAAAFRLRGALDALALRRSFDAIVRRHEILRTRFVDGVDGPVQVVDAATDFVMPVVDCAPTDVADRIRAHACAAFDLRTDQLLRVTLLRLAPDEHVLLVNLHHIVGDGWSIGVLVHELNALYASAVHGLPAALAPLPVQYADYAVWQRRCLSGTMLQRQLAYWRQQLAGLPPLLELPGDGPRPPVQTLRAGVHRFVIDRDLQRRLEAFNQSHGVSLLMTLSAAFQALLARHSGQSDIAIGTPFANRSRPEFEGLIGFFVNTVVLRSRVETAANFAALLSQVRDTVLAAQANQDLPFEQLVEELKPARSMSYAPLVQVMLVVNDGAVDRLHLPGVAIERVQDRHAVARFDLALNIEPQGDELQAWFDYAADLYSAPRMARLAAHFLRLLDTVLGGAEVPLGALPLLDADEIAAQLEPQYALDAGAVGSACVHELIAQQAARLPGALAVMFENSAMSYAELEQRANRLARHLQALGATAEQHVGVWMERSPELLVAMLAIWKCGAIYVPLDPGYPKERLDYVIADAGIVCVVADRALTQRLPPPQGRCLFIDDVDARSSASLPPLRSVAVHALQPAYVIYTSGSTGQPKGVQVLHGGLAALLQGLQRRFEVTHRDSMLSVASQSFGIAFVELLLPLIAAGHTRIVARERVLDTAALLRDLQQVTLAHLVPSLMRRVLDEVAEAGGAVEAGTLRRVFVGGDAVAPALLSDMAAAFPRVAVVELYGQTETTILSTCAPQHDAPSPGNVIGTRLDHAQVYVLDADQGLLPQGSVGEICVAGHGVARGYLGRPAQTAERFVPHPFSRVAGARLYRTGDLGRLRGDGSIEYLGRADFQVNIRGFRIELGEIESVLRAQPQLQSVVVAAREDARGDQQLVAYLVALPGASADVTALRLRLRAALPDYMMPAHFVVLDAFPLNANGKLDRRALPAPERDESSAHVAPRNPLEQELAALWAELLSVTSVGVNDNFFEMGGHSLLAAQAMARVRQRFGIALGVADFFDAQTVAQLAIRIERVRREQTLLAQLTATAPADAQELERIVL